MAGLHSHQVIRAGDWSGAQDLVTLSYADRFLRRKRLETVAGHSFVVDLPETTSLAHGDAFLLSDGSLVEVIAAEEVLLAVTGDNLPRLAWHIGNRHTPCQIEKDRLLIAHDHVLADMLRGLGATVDHVREPFTPEGGAYGHGRTMGHDHGPGEGHAHGHAHVHHHVSHHHDEADEPEGEPE